MDKLHFDDLARAWGTIGTTRRTALRLLAGSALASLGMTSVAAASAQAKGDGQGQKHRRRAFRAEKCTPSGRKCVRNPEKGKHSDSVACKNCCGRSRELTKNTGICRNDNGKPCRSTAWCCLAVLC